MLYIVIRKLPDATQHKEKPHYRRCIASYISYCVVYRKYRMLDGDGGFLCYGLRIPRKLNTTSKIILVQSKQNKNSIRMGESSLPQTKKCWVYIKDSPLLVMVINENTNNNKRRHIYSYIDQNYCVFLKYVFFSLFYNILSIRNHNIVKYFDSFSPIDEFYLITI